MGARLNWGHAMRAFLLSSVAVVGLSFPALSQELDVSAGFTLTSRYVSSGFALSDGVAFQPWAEASLNGFYVGAWGSNTSPAGAGADFELDLYLGYRNEIGQFNYDIGYAHYFMISPSSSSGEAYLNMGVAVTEQVNLGVGLRINPASGVWNTSLNGDVSVTDKISLSAQVGRYTDGSSDYYNIGASYAFNDALSFDLSYHNSTSGSLPAGGLIVGGLNYSFSLR
jgi:uncharacterized protein (TIGR02001 family)